MSSATKKQEANTSQQVLDFLRAAPAQEFSPKEIADSLDLVPVRVSAALQYLSRQHPEVKNERRGIWSYNPNPTRSGGVSRHMTTNGDVVDMAPTSAIVVAPVGLPDQMAPVFVPVTTHRSGATVLRDSHGDLWLAQPIQVDMWPVLGALGFEPPEEAKTKRKR